MAVDPWEMLAKQPDVMFWREPLPASTGGAAYATDGDVAVIRLDPSLDQRERRAAVLHELIHHRDGVPCGDRRSKWLTCQAIEDEVADLLIPPAELRTWWVAAEELGEHVTPDVIAEAFHTPQDLAERAMRRLLQRLRPGGRQ